MAGQIGVWDIEHRLAELSAEGDPLETLPQTVDFDVFRPILERAVRRRSAPSKGGRPGSEMQNAGVAIAAWLGAGADGVLGA